MKRFISSMFWIGVLLAYFAVWGCLQAGTMYGFADQLPYRWLYAAGFALWIMLGGATLLCIAGGHSGKGE